MSPSNACDTPTTNQLASLLRNSALDIRELIRRLLPSVGLRNSLFRVKVLTLLLYSTTERLDAERVHRLLEEQVGMSLNLTNTRDVLRRLAKARLAVKSERNCYAVSAWTVNELQALAVGASAAH